MNAVLAPVRVATGDDVLVRFEVILPLGSDALTPTTGTHPYGEQIAHRTGS